MPQTKNEKRRKALAKLEAELRLDDSKFSANNPFARGSTSHMRKHGEANTLRKKLGLPTDTDGREVTCTTH